MPILGKKWFTCEHENAATGSATGGIVDGSSYCLLLNDEVRSNTAKPWSSYDSTYDPKSQQLLNIPTASDYHCTKRLFSYCVEKYHATLFHTQPLWRAVLHGLASSDQKSYRFFTICWTMVRHGYVVHWCIIRKALTGPVWSHPLYTR